MTSGAARLVVLVSGGGTNLQALLNGCAAGALDADVALVVSNRADAGALARASRAGVPTEVALRRAGTSRESYDRVLAEVVVGAAPDLVVLAGFMWVLGPAFLARVSAPIVNLHPAWPGELPGVDAIGRAWAEALRGERAETGVMIHRVVEEVDAGPVVVAERVATQVEAGRAAFEARMHAVEHRLIVEGVRRVLRAEGFGRMPAPDEARGDSDA